MQLVSPITPLKHQTTALQRAKRAAAYAFLMETGTGKTYVVLDEWQQFVAEGRWNTAPATVIRDLLVIAPAGSIRNWYKRKADDQPCELEKFLDPKLLSSMVFAGWGNKKSERDACDNLLGKTKRPRALFVNIEALSNSAAPAFRVCEELLKQGHTYMAIDESTTIRNAKAARTERIIELGKLAKVRRIMTGLVAPKSPLDLYWQFNFLDPAILEYESFVAFRAYYAKVKYQCFMPTELIRARLKKDVIISSRRQGANSEVKLYSKLRHFLEVPGNYKFKNPKPRVVQIVIDKIADMERVDMIAAAERMGTYINQVPIIEEYRNLPELQQKIAPHSYQVLKKDCLDLHPKTYVPRTVELTDEQKRIYKDIREDAVAQLASLDYVSADTAVAQILRLHQVVCGHVRDEERKLHDIESNRIDTIKEVIDDYEGKAIIWTTYTHELGKIVAELNRYYGPGSAAAFYGGNKNTRHHDEERFLNDPQCRFMVSTQSAGGRGNTWNVAALTIYAANSYDLEMRFQSEDRNHRVGQRNAVTYIDLITPDTVEVKIIQCLRRKLDLATIITNENYREWLI